MLVALEKGGSNKMKGSISMSNMCPCIIVITNPTKDVKVPRDGGEHVINGNIEEEKLDEKTQLDDIVEKMNLQYGGAEGENQLKENNMVIKVEHDGCKTKCIGE
jgi:hypothetical protein